MSVRRVTIRLLIGVVALAAVGVWAVKMWDRSTEFAQTAEKHRQLSGLHILNAVTFSSRRKLVILKHSASASWLSENKAYFDNLDVRIAAYRRDAAYEEGLYLKYRRAARFPWLSVAADPPPPKPSGSDIPWLGR